MQDEIKKTKSIEIWSSEFNRVFEFVFEHSLIGMAILSPEGNFLRVNQKACEIWEFSEKELIGKHWSDITYPEDLELSTLYTNSYTGKSEQYSIIIEKRYVTGCGKILTCKVTTTAIRNQDGTISYFITQVQDITQKKETLFSLKKGLEFIQSIKEKS